ncbi:hypothetical protein [Coleofasciculus sp. F4-SAH-05]|uniref:hypothetical protein n=1 Tax=Coleofasciculus sp. F4-SAH-05 TaxID=3069525 RepID=UPI0033050098
MKHDFCHWSLVIGHWSFVIRHSSFVIRHSSFVICHLSFVKSGRVYLHLGVTEKIVVKPAPTQFASSDTPSEVEVFPHLPHLPE